MKRLIAALVVGVMVLGMAGIAAAAGTITITTFPLNVDGRAENVSTPFAVHVTISNWTDVANSQAKVRVTTTSGAHLSIWSGSGWGTANIYANAPTVTIDANGDWLGWIYLKSRSSTGPIKAYARDISEVYTLSETASHSITYMDMSTSGAWVHATAAPAAAGKAVLAFDSADKIIGTYAIENNEVDEGLDYPTTAGYFRMAVPADTEIPKLQARNADNSIFDTQTSEVWESGEEGTETDLDGQEDVTLPVTLASFTAIAGDGEITLCWRTESEVDNLGFNLYRSRSEEGGYALIASYKHYESLQGAGSSTISHDYSFEDGRLRNGVTYYYLLEDVDFQGNKTRHGPVSATPTAPFVEPEDSHTPPEKSSLSQNYPNPFNAGTHIRFSLRRPGRVTLAIYNIKGQLVRSLMDTELAPREYTVRWDGKDDDGRPVASGIYIYSLQTEGFVDAKKMILLK